MIGQLIKNIREKKNIFLKDISKETGISIGHLSNIENNRKIPNIEHFIKICDALKVTYNEFKILHLEYEKNLKLINNDNLILAILDNKYLLSIILEKIHFKNKFLSLFEKASVDGKLTLSYLFFNIIIYFFHFMELEITANNFYFCIDLLKEKSSKLLKFDYVEVNGANFSENDLLKNYKILSLAKGEKIELNNKKYVYAWFEFLFKDELSFKKIIYNSSDLLFENLSNTLAEKYNELFKLLKIDNKEELLMQKINIDNIFLKEIINTFNLNQKYMKAYKDTTKKILKENQSLKQQIKLLEEELKKYKKEGKAGKD